MIQTCLFPAAGYGTRFLPATKSLPKEMLPILTKPLIHYGVDEALEAGMDNMAFVTGRGKRALRTNLTQLRARKRDRRQLKRVTTKRS